MKPSEHLWLKGELLSRWQRSILDVKAALSIWSDLRAAEAGDPSKLKEYIRWDGPGFVCYDTFPDVPLPDWSRAIRRVDYQEIGRLFLVIAAENRNPATLRLFRPGDKFSPARHCLQELINNWLKIFAVPQILPKVDQGKSLYLQIVPKHLLGTICLQLAEAIHGGQQLRRCLGCNVWMVISRDSVGNRSSRLTCSNACRMRTYNRRKDQARQLRAEGLPLRQIAKRVNSDAKTVRGWI